jgi:DNA-directed RNA polymerase subunit RPC12/RpoP
MPIKYVCDKCGKEMPTNKEMSNHNWTVYKEDCPCGGKKVLKF